MTYWWNRKDEAEVGVKTGCMEGVGAITVAT